MSIPVPLILDDAGVKIATDGTEATLTELACVTSHVELTPDVATTTLDTMCGSVDYPGTVKWQLVATFYQSFDPDATEETLSAAVDFGEPVPFALVGYKSKPVSATNPEWSGFVIPQPYSPINGDAGDASEVEIEWSVVGEPVKSVTPIAAMAAGVSSGYEDLTLEELRQLAAEKGVSVSGTKAELAERLG